MNIYAPEVDQEGHRTGPHSHGVESELIEMDNFALDVMNELEKRNLTDVVDVIFLSDHGMTETHDERLVFLDDILGEEGWKGIARNEGPFFFLLLNIVVSLSPLGNKIGY